MKDFLTSFLVAIFIFVLAGGGGFSISHFLHLPWIVELLLGMTWGFLVGRFSFKIVRWEARRQMKKKYPEVFARNPEWFK